MQKKYIAIFILAIIIRIWFAAVNYEQFDDHMEVITRIMDDKSVDLGSCWECQQPKFYYYINAIIFSFLNINPDNRLFVAQMINSIVGIMTLIIVYLFLIKFKVSENAKFFTFALISLNPKLIALNGIVSNDTFSIFFSTIAIIYAFNFFTRPKIDLFLIMSLSTILAILSKATALPIFFSIVIFFFLNMKKNNWKLNIFYLFFYLFLFLLVVPYFGEYIDRYQKYNYPFIAKPFDIYPYRSPAPYFFRETSVSVIGYPYYFGVTSIFHSFFTFRIFDLVEHPFMNPSHPHFTSYWSSLYARFNSIHFDMHPDSWKPQNKLDYDILSGIFIFGLVTIAIFFAGVFINLKKIFKSWKISSNDIFLVFIIFQVSFLIYLNLLYRDVSFTRAAYLFPVVLCLVKFILDGLNFADNRLIISPLIILIFFYLVEILVLLISLTKHALS